MSYPKELFRNIYWSFSVGKIENKNKFMSEIEKYHKTISGTKIPVKSDEVVFDFPSFELQYVKYTDDDVEEPYELVVADNGLNFKADELLFKIHQVGVNLEKEDNCYFEGLTYSGENNEEGVPIYFLDTGS